MFANVMSPCAPSARLGSRNAGIVSGSSPKAMKSVVSIVNTTCKRNLGAEVFSASCTLFQSFLPQGYVCQQLRKELQGG